MNVDPYGSTLVNCLFAFIAIQYKFGFKLQMFDKSWWLALADQNFEKYSFLKIQINQKKWLKWHSDDIRLYLDTTKLTF